MESHLHELEESNKELTDHKYRSEAAIRELKAKLKTTEEVAIKVYSKFEWEVIILACLECIAWTRYG